MCEFLHVCMCTTFMCHAYRGQRVLDLLEQELQLWASSPYGIWGLNLGLMQKQPVLLTTEPSFQPLKENFGMMYSMMFSWTRGLASLELLQGPAKWLRGLMYPAATLLTSLRWIPGIHMVEGENWLWKVVFWGPQVHTQIGTK